MEKSGGNPAGADWKRPDLAQKKLFSLRFFLRETQYLPHLQREGNEVLFNQQRA